MIINIYLCQGRDRDNKCNPVTLRLLRFSFYLLKYRKPAGCWLPDYLYMTICRSLSVFYHYFVCSFFCYCSFTSILKCTILPFHVCISRAQTTSVFRSLHYQQFEIFCKFKFKSSRFNAKYFIDCPICFVFCKRSFSLTTWI
jgi:hypothetical protein